MKLPQNLLRDSLILLLLIAFGVASRFILIDIPNFKPIASIVLFTAFWFRSYWVAGLALVLMMIVSNSGLDDCPWQVSLGVIGGLGVAALLGRRLQTRMVDVDAVQARPINAASQLLGTVLVMSLAFFIVSNFAVWSMGAWYPLTFEGLAHCYVAAIPFFKFTLLGDLTFACGVFSIWYLVSSCAKALSRRLVAG